jgi:hypothetical protein
LLGGSSSKNPIRPTLVTILAQRRIAMAKIRKRGIRWQAQVRRMTALPPKAVIRLGAAQCPLCANGEHFLAGIRAYYFERYRYAISAVMLT